MQKIELTQSVYLPTYDGCFVCGQSHPWGLQARFIALPTGQVQVSFIPQKTQAGYEGMAHGGIISALFDELLGWAVVLKTERMCLTAELTVRYLKPIRLGIQYVATANPGSDHGRYWESEGNLQDAGGVIHAKAQGKYFLLSEEQTVQVVERMTYQLEDVPAFRKKQAPGSL